MLTVMADEYGYEWSPRVAWKSETWVLVPFLAFLFISAPRCDAQERPVTMVVSRLCVDKSSKSLATSGASAGGKATASDLIAAEKFLAAPVRGDMLLTTYDCVFPIGEHEFYVESTGKVISVELWAADPWMNLAILKSKDSVFAPIKLSGGETIEKSQTYLLAAGATFDLGAERSVPVVETGLRLKASSNEGALSVHEFGDLVGVKSKRFLPPGTPLFDSDGLLRLIAIGLPSESPNLSLCIAVDTPCAKAIAALISGEPLTYGFLGLEPANVSDLPGGQGQRGVYARQVTDHSPAKNGGIRAENPRTGEVDIIAQINGAAVESGQHLLSIISRLSFGDKIQLTVKRGKIGNLSSPMQLECTLAKRFASPLRPAFSLKPKYTWRGVTVDHFTAIDDFAARARLVDPQGCVVILSVDQESAAWKAGLRAGMFLSKVNDVRIKSEAEFQEATKSLSGAAKLVTTSRADGLRIEPQTFELAP